MNRLTVGFSLIIVLACTAASSVLLAQSNPFTGQKSDSAAKSPTPADSNT